MKHTHTEGPGSVLKSRFARGLFPLVAALLAFALAAPEARAAAVPAPDQPVLIDTSASAGSVVTSSVSAVAYPASKAFDGAWSTINSDRWLAYINPNKNDYTGGFTGETPAYVTYKFNTATKVNVLRIRIPKDDGYECSDRAPKAWTFLGSNDGTTWTTLDTRTGVTWASEEVTKTFSFENHKSYEYYKFVCTEIGGVNDYLQIYELQFLYDAGIVLTDLTTSSSGSVSSSSGTHSSYPATKAFDGNKSDTNGRWLSTKGDNMYLVYHFNAATAVNAIRIWSGLSNAGGASEQARAPKAWTFSGSNDGTNWTPLDKQTSETGWSGARYYQFVNNAAYEYYKYNCTELNGGTDYLQIWEIEFYYVNLGGPMIGDVSLARTGAATYALSATEDANAADLAWIADDGASATTNGWQSVADGGTANWTVSGLAVDTTYEISVLATNENGTAETAAGTVYTGTLSLGAATDASENGLIAGTVAVSRNSRDPFPLIVNYTISSSAAGAAEGTTWAEPTTVTIPAGETTGYLLVTPLLDSSVTENVEVTVTLAAGNYEMPAVSAKTLQIINLVAPTGYNTWIATADGLASVDSNWSAGHAPLATEQVLFDGRFSTANCEWDAAASATVASWTQTNGYTGTVTFDTEFPDYSGATFPLFTISGDCVIASGKWSCRGNYNNYGAEKPSYTYKTDKRWCLNVAVGGAMQVASGASITATGRGFGFPNDSSSASKSYGGYAYGGGTAPYGSIKEPFDPGMGARAQGDQNGRISAIGGGAIKIAVTGALTLDGSIVALGTADQNIARAGGTGGSIWISASQIAGAGKIDASAPTGIGNDQIVGTGSGGRIALYTQSPIVFPMNNVACSGTGYRGTSWEWNSRVSGAGTIYVYDPTQTNGTLYVKQSTTVSTQNSKWTGTPVMGDLALDAVVLSGRTFLRIPEGASLTLPSLAAVTTDNTGAGQAGLVYDGGTLNIGSGSQTLKANVAFSSPTAFSFPGDLTLETGAKLGSLNSMYGTAANDYDQTFTVSVAGNLTIPADASAGATRCCALTASGKARYAASHGGQSLYLAAEARTNGFDSVLNPSMPGGSANCNFPAGGAFTLTVGGTLTLDGPMTADGGGARGSDSTYDGTSAGAGGTLNITAGALAGGGKMSAEGGCGRSNYAGGAGGGRVAVRLTGADSTFSDWWTTNVFARGESFASGNGKASSAGTVYLQTAADGEAGGCVTIRNDLALQAGATNNLATTRYPGNGDGCDAPSALKKTRLLIDGASRVELTDDLRLIGLTMASDTVLDLNGKTLAVRSAMLGNVKLAPGTYAADNAAVAGFVVDSATGGALVVTGGGFTLRLR